MRLRRPKLTFIGLFVVACLGVAAVMAVSRRQEARTEEIFASTDLACRSGHYDEADAALIRLALRRQPTAIDHYLRAEVALGLKRELAALTELKAIPDDHPLAPLARLRAGQTQIRLGRARPAEAVVPGRPQTAPTRGPAP